MIFVLDMVGVNFIVFLLIPLSQIKYNVPNQCSICIVKDQSNEQNAVFRKMTYGLATS